MFDLNNNTKIIKFILIVFFVDAVTFVYYTFYATWLDSFFSLPFMFWMLGPGALLRIISMILSIMLLSKGEKKVILIPVLLAFLYFMFYNVRMMIPITDYEGQPDIENIYLSF